MLVITGARPRLDNRDLAPTVRRLSAASSTQAYADFASQLTIMKRRRTLEDANYSSAKSTIVQLVLGGLGLGVKLVARLQSNPP